MLPLEGSAPGTPGPPKLPLEEPFVAYSRDDRAAEVFKNISFFNYLQLDYILIVFYTCIRICSNLTGLGIKPTSQPSLTNRPIHQLLSYFSLI